MLIYYGLIFIIGIIAFGTTMIRNKTISNSILIIVSVLSIVLLQGLRNPSVGIDLIGYIPSYHIAKSINVFAGERIQNYEVGYILYSKIFSILGFSDQLYLAIIALTIIAPLTYVWSKYSKMIWLSIYLYITLGFFTFSFSGLRQSIAIAITFLSFKFIQEKRAVIFLLCIALAMTFHKTALIFIFAYPLYYLKFRRIHFALIIPTLMLVFTFRSEIFTTIYRIYRGNDIEIVSTNAYTMLIIMILIWLLAYAFGNKDKRDMKLNAYKNYMLVTIVIQLFASQSNTIMRLGYYYYIFITLLIPEVINHQRDRKVKILVVSALVIASMLFFQMTSGNGYLNFSPYFFYWE